MSKYSAAKLTTFELARERALAKDRALYLSNIHSRHAIGWRAMEQVRKGDRFAARGQQSVLTDAIRAAFKSLRQSPA
jgi:hypothetical protein